MSLKKSTKKTSKKTADQNHLQDKIKKTKKQTSLLKKQESVVNDTKKPKPLTFYTEKARKELAEHKHLSPNCDTLIDATFEADKISQQALDNAREILDEVIDKSKDISIDTANKSLLDQPIDPKLSDEQVGEILDTFLAADDIKKEELANREIARKIEAKKADTEPQFPVRDRIYAWYLNKLIDFSLWLTDYAKSVENWVAIKVLPIQLGSDYNRWKQLAGIESDDKKKEPNYDELKYRFQKLASITINQK